MLNRYMLLIFGNKPIQYHSDKLDKIKGMMSHNDSYIVIDMTNGFLIEDRRPKNIGDPNQAVYEFIHHGRGKALIANSEERLKEKEKLP
jgi:hypothetical protein